MRKIIDLQMELLKNDFAKIVIDNQASCDI